MAHLEMNSRTGEAIMVPSKKGGFRFESEHAGTIDDNWYNKIFKKTRI